MVARTCSPSFGPWASREPNRSPRPRLYSSPSGFARIWRSSVSIIDRQCDGRDRSKLLFGSLSALSASRPFINAAQPLRAFVPPETSLMPDLQDGESVEVKGSAAKPYVLKNVGGVYSCSCPAWRNQCD